MLSVQQLEVLRRAALELGDGRLELTSRANVQIRALRPDGLRELSDRLFTAGLLPSITHERVRNILASPLSGLDQESRYDVLPLAAAVDRELCGRPALAELPGRFLFALDDGRGDLAGVRADVFVRALDDREALLSLGTRAVRVRWDDAAELMVAAAEAFLVERDGEEWRIAELEDGENRILSRLGVQATEALPTTSTTVSAGWHGTALVVTVPLGSLTQEQATAVTQAISSADKVAAAGEGAASSAGRAGGAGWAGVGIRLTPWRSVVLPAVSTGPLERVGLVTTPDSPWNGVTACAGRPGCSKALADVRADAWRVVPTMGRDGRRVHWSGCERRCGKPAGEFVDVVAVGNGYLVDGEPM